MSKFKGFGHELTEKEWTVLRVFRDRDCLVFPVDCGLSVDDTLDTLLALTKKRIIKGKSPYKLTRLGKRLLEI